MRVPPPSTRISPLPRAGEPQRDFQASKPAARSRNVMVTDRRQRQVLWKTTGSSGPRQRETRDPAQPRASERHAGVSGGRSHGHLAVGEDRGQWGLSASYAADAPEHRWKCDDPNVTNPKGGTR